MTGKPPPQGPAEADAESSYLAATTTVFWAAQMVKQCGTERSCSPPSTCGGRSRRVERERGGQDPCLQHHTGVGEALCESTPTMRGYKRHGDPHAMAPATQVGELWATGHQLLTGGSSTIS